ncbi:MAG TPA: hypothetical protein VI408_00275 [Gaiellaceae bacterium]
MHKTARVLAVVLVALAASAAVVAPPSRAAATSLSGSWSGSYSGTFRGTFTLHWRQAGSKLTGTISLNGARGVPLTGVVSGASIRFGTVGSVAVTYTGKVSGSSMSGRYRTPSGTGSWSAHRGS